MSYLRYANICADLMRKVMKEPYKSKALQRAQVNFREAVWHDGKMSTPGELL